MYDGWCQLMWAAIIFIYHYFMPHRQARQHYAAPFSRFISLIDGINFQWAERAITPLSPLFILLLYTSHLVLLIIIYHVDWLFYHHHLSRCREAGCQMRDDERVLARGAAVQRCCLKRCWCHARLLPHYLPWWDAALKMPCCCAIYDGAFSFARRCRWCSDDDDNHALFTYITLPSRHYYLPTTRPPPPNHDYLMFCCCCCFIQECCCHEQDAAKACQPCLPCHEVLLAMPDYMQAGRRRWLPATAARLPAAMKIDDAMCGIAYMMRRFSHGYSCCHYIFIAAAMQKDNNAINNNRLLGLLIIIMLT